jgi:hypothetical protein
MLFRGFYYGIDRVARCPPACNQRVAIDMESPNIRGRKVANAVIPINNCQMFRQILGADRANALLVLQLVGQ